MGGLPFSYITSARRLPWFKSYPYVLTPLPDSHLHIAKNLISGTPFRYSKHRLPPHTILHTRTPAATMSGQKDGSAKSSNGGNMDAAPSSPIKSRGRRNAISVSSLQELLEPLVSSDNRGREVPHPASPSKEQHDAPRPVHVDATADHPSMSFAMRKLTEKMDAHIPLQENKQGRLVPTCSCPRRAGDADSSAASSPVPCAAPLKCKWLHPPPPKPSMPKRKVRVPTTSFLVSLTRSRG